MYSDKVARLRELPIFAGLDEKTLQAVAQFRIRRFEANDTLFREGNEAYEMYVVLSGHVHIEKDGPSGKTVYLAQRGPGELVGELSLIDGKPHVANVRTS